MAGSPSDERRWRFSLRGLMAAIGGVALLLGIGRVGAEQFGVAFVLMHAVVDSTCVVIVLMTVNCMQVQHRLPAWRSALLFVAHAVASAFVAAACGAVGDMAWGIATLGDVPGRYGYFLPACVLLSVLASSAYFAIYRRNVCRES